MSSLKSFLRNMMHFGVGSKRSLPLSDSENACPSSFSFLIRHIILPSLPRFHHCHASHP